MEQSANLAREVYSTIKGSFMLDRGARSAYARMEQESENEENEINSLFYSVQQDDIGDENIPLTDSHDYSDRSQLLFDREEELDNDPMDLSNASASALQHSDYEESPKPSAIYLDVPSAAPAAYSNPKSLSESLLPTSAAIPAGITTIKIDKKFRDPFFAGLFVFTLIVFLVIGLIVTFTTNSHAIERFARGTTFKTITDCAGIMSIMIAIAMVVGAAWIYILRTFTKALVWGTVICAPLAFLAIFIWSLTESFQSYYFYGGSRIKYDSSLTALSFIPLLLNLIYITLVYRSRHRINKTISVIELACDVLRNNPGIILVSLILMIAFIVFTSVWMVFFSRLWLVGHSEMQTPKTGSIWVVYDHVYIMAVFFIFVYMWSAAVLINIQRFVLSAVTSQWYFHRNDPGNTNSEKAWKSALIRAYTTSLGTLALAGLILSIVQMLHLLARYMKKYVKKNRPLVTVVAMCLGYVEGLISQINHYTISLAGITGESFCASARSGTKLFRRNLLSGLLGDLLTKLILYIGSLLISLSSGFGTYIFASHTLHSSHGLLVGMLAAVVPMYLSQFFSYTMMSM
ncbi:hypothetical protein DFQ28_006079 [Apophysomyces sp. BC1034]|nr:hypothetical protein DFQ30_006047 [Apophysomyces sp. BC1015]KAG0177337.1 hypothetical protein DFQ29_004960 [Apophysomyces sp. BC1021]KAG0187616.1 hypothetical protein DFQ28_006079 [Apophysomyces sp. BC1034]